MIIISLTVEESLKIGAFKQCTLLAGTGGLTREVSYISSMEVPNVKAWAVKKQLLITTAYAIRNSPAQLTNILRDLSAAGVSGLGLKTKFIGEIPADVIRLADELKMPLVQIPEHILFIDIITPIMKTIINEQNIKLEFSEKIYTKLMELNLTEGGLPHITDFIFSATGMPAAITDTALSLLSAKSSPQRPSFFTDFLSLHAAKLNKFSLGRELITTIYTETKAIYLMRKILIKNKICGYILISAGEKPPDETALIVVEHAATAAALEFSKAQALQKQVKLMENSFYIDLITENVKNEEEAYQRARSLSWPKLPLSLIVFNIDHFESVITRKSEAEIFQIKDHIRQIITTCFDTLNKQTPIIQSSDSFSCLLPNLQCRETIISVVEQALQSVRKKTNLQLTAGICLDIKNYTDLKNADQDAVESIHICRCEARTEKYVFTESLKLEKALLTMIDSPYIRDFIDSTIGQLLAFDEKNQTKLTDTLDEFIKCMGIRGKTAQNLYIHRNTLTQRLKKIESIIGYDLSRNQELLALGIAMKIQKFLD